MWNLEQTERFVLRTRPIILGITSLGLLLMSLLLNPVRLGQVVTEPASITLQHNLN